jgi:hypothetical protein
VHGRLKKRSLQQRASFWENFILILIGVSGFFVAVSADSRGIPRKWVTALFGTLIPFGLVIYLRRRNLRWLFWFALATCLSVHLVIVWIFFQFVLADFKNFSILLWLPVMLAEIFVLLIVIKRIEGRVSGKKETIKIGF